MKAKLNERVYCLFDLTPNQIRIIEQATAYNYGEA